MDVWASGNSQN